MKIIKVDQPKIVEGYMNEFCKKNKVVTLQTKEKMEKEHQRKRLTRSARRSKM